MTARDDQPVIPHLVPDSLPDRLPLVLLLLVLVPPLPLGLLDGLQTEALLLFLLLLGLSVVVVAAGSHPGNAVCKEKARVKKKLNKKRGRFNTPI